MGEVKEREKERERERERGDIEGENTYVEFLVVDLDHGGIRTCSKTLNLCEGEHLVLGGF